MTPAVWLEPAPAACLEHGLGKAAIAANQGFRTIRSRPTRLRMNPVPYRQTRAAMISPPAKWPAPPRLGRRATGTVRPAPMPPRNQRGPPIFVRYDLGFAFDGGHSCHEPPPLAQTDRYGSEDFPNVRQVAPIHAQRGSARRRSECPVALRSQRRLLCHCGIARSRPSTRSVQISLHDGFPSTV